MLGVAGNKWGRSKVAEIQTHKAGCPYCGETIELLVDPAMAGDAYIEDCFVCCRPITILVSAWGSQDNALLEVILSHEDEV